VMDLAERLCRRQVGGKRWQEVARGDAWMPLLLPR
jgi:hypothetical protein